MFATTVSIVVTYGWLLQRAGAVRTRRIVTYAVFMVFLGLMACQAAAWFYFVIVGDPGFQFSVRDVALPRTTTSLLFPGTWFAAYVPVAHGSVGHFELAAVGLSIVYLVVLVVLIRGRISEHYLRRTAELTMDTTARLVKPDPAWSLIRGERRAIAVLMRHQLRADLQLQTSVVMSVVMTFLFIGMNVYSEGRPLDPFGQSWRDGIGTGFMTILGFAMMPGTMWSSLTRSMTPRAAWPFFATASDRARLVTAMRDVIALMALLPTLLVSFGVYVWAFRHAGHALLFTLVVAVFAYIELQITVLADPTMPLSRPAVASSPGTLPFRVGSMFVNVLALPLWILTSLVVFRGATGYVVGLTLLAATSVGLSWLTRRRILKRQHTMQYFE
jgi:hypothetical protein